MATTTETAAPSNEDRRAGRLNRQALRAARYRARIAAQSEIRIRRYVGELNEIGREPVVDLELPDVEHLTDAELVALAEIRLEDA